MFISKSRRRRGGGVSFKHETCLVNSQFQFKTLGELVSQYKRTGEFPAVGMHNGVYFASGINDEVPAMSPMDKMQMADQAEAIISQYSDLEKQAKQANDEKNKSELESLRARVAELEKQPVNPPTV